MRQTRTIRSPRRTAALLLLAGVFCATTAVAQDTSVSMAPFIQAGPVGIV